MAIKKASTRKKAKRKSAKRTMPSKENTTATQTPPAPSEGEQEILESPPTTLCDAQTERSNAYVERCKAVVKANAADALALAKGVA